MGETDRAILLMVGEGTLNWDAPEVTYRTPEAQNFLHMVLQADPEYESFNIIILTLLLITNPVTHMWKNLTISSISFNVNETILFDGV